MNAKRRYVFEMSKKELGTFLRSLAKILENDDASQAADLGLDLSNMRKLKFSAKTWPDDPLQVKIKITPWKTEDSEEEESEEDAYARLKKRMKAYYKELHANLQANQQPSREIVSVFLKDCFRMTEFQGYGDEYYPIFTKACHEFQEAFDQEELKGMQRAFDRIESLKDRCHERYK